MMNNFREGACHKHQTGNKYTINIGCKNVGNEPHGIHRHIWKDHNKIKL